MTMTSTVTLSDGSSVTVAHVGLTFDGRQSYSWRIDFANGYGFSSLSGIDDVNSGCGAPIDAPTRSRSLSSFLGAFAEASEHGECFDLFPIGLRDWAEANVDELSSLVES